MAFKSEHLEYNEHGDGCPNLVWLGKQRTADLLTQDNHELARWISNSISARHEDEWKCTPHARISTQGKREFQYGKIEVRAKLPIG